MVFAVREALEKRDKRFKQARQTQKPPVSKDRALSIVSQTETEIFSKPSRKGRRRACLPTSGKARSDPACQWQVYA
jgi:hypothetical protein